MSTTTESERTVLTIEIDHGVARDKTPEEIRSSLDLELKYARLTLLEDLERALNRNDLTV
jgi:hypothetical protein